ncbi:SDR family oxidoreductase [Alginatibacterium sediminis]|uniref:SDR family oxidoreductase n=1 Tax=Alginatibacterium sediminis TaxID=2164068 RepID=A0A420EGY4_9ALTE|nr:SDR family oxidoreductase [Alginatibacterium sediminis]RKF19981.1 SDR family oxidoreductase [Alginatibacterium sediminis]
MYKTILVTGATSGIGLALTHELCNKGFTVLASGRNLAQLNKLQLETSCFTFQADLSDPTQVIDLYNYAERELNGVDVLINNAGMNSRKCGIDEFTLEEFDQQYAINLRAPALLCREALNAMKPRGYGYIINVSSTVAKRANETMSVYTAMKQGLSGFSGILMKEAQTHGIKVSTLFPGGTDTNFREATRPDYMQPSSVATTITTLLSLPQDVIVHEMTFRPSVELE